MFLFLAGHSLRALVRGRVAATHLLHPNTPCLGSGRTERRFDCVEETQVRLLAPSTNVSSEGAQLDEGMGSLVPHSSFLVPDVA